MFHIKLAEVPFTIDNRFAYVERLCRDYATQEPGDVIAVSAGELAAENQGGGNWPEPYLESLALYRKLCERLLSENVLLFHASALAVDGKAYLFTAPSGTGKSTHARLWRERFGARVTMINDDKPLLRIGRKEIRVYGTPYGGKDQLQTNTSAPVAGIVLLHQAKENHICRVSANEAYPMLLNQTYRRKDPAGLLRTLELVKELAKVPIWSMGCTASREAAELAYGALIGN